MLATGVRQLDPAHTALIGQTVSKIMSRLATDRTFASQVTAAANARDSFALQRLISQTGVQASAATASSSTTSPTILTIEVTVCYNNVCYKVTVTIH